MPRTKGVRNFTIHELRRRHEHCVTMNDINRDVIRGVITEKMFAKQQLIPVCDYPEDGICLGPAIAASEFDNYKGTYQ